MAYTKRNRKYTAKKIIVKPKVQWSLHRQTGTCHVRGPKKPTGGWINQNIVTHWTSLTLTQCTTDSAYIPGFVKKVKHLKVEIARSFTADNEVLHKGLIKMKAYIMYLPQGVEFSSNDDANSGLPLTIAQHPEWILAEKTLNCNYKSDASTVSNQSLYCKLSKNLKSGDMLKAFIVAFYDPNTVGTTDLSGYNIPCNLEWTFAMTQ